MLLEQHVVRPAGALVCQKRRVASFPNSVGQRGSEGGQRRVLAALPYFLPPLPPFTPAINHCTSGGGQPQNLIPVPV